MLAVQAVLAAKEAVAKADLEEVLHESCTVAAPERAQGY